MNTLVIIGRLLPLLLLLFHPVPVATQGSGGGVREDLVNNEESVDYSGDGENEAVLPAVRSSQRPFTATSSSTPSPVETINRANSQVAVEPASSPVPPVVLRPLPTAPLLTSDQRVPHALPPPPAWLNGPQQPLAAPDAHHPRLQPQQARLHPGVNGPTGLGGDCLTPRGYGYVQQVLATTNGTRVRELARRGDVLELTTRLQQLRRVLTNVNRVGSLVQDDAEETCVERVVDRLSAIQVEMRRILLAHPFVSLLVGLVNTLPGGGGGGN